MKTNLILILLCLSLGAYSQTVKKIDQRKGFKHFIFGSPKTSFKDIVPNEYGNYNLHSSIDTLTIGKFKLTEGQVSFENNKLSDVSFTVYGSENIIGVLLALKKAYGEPVTRKNDSEEHYEWTGKYVFIAYTITYKNPHGLLIFVDNAVRKANKQKLNKDKNNEVNKAADEL